MEIAKSKFIGLVEKVTIVGKEKSRTVLARIDTGAVISSIDIKRYTGIINSRTR